MNVFIAVRHLLVVGELQCQLNVHVRADLAGFDEVLPVRLVPVDVEVEILNPSRM